MESIIKHGKHYNQHLFRLDDGLNTKLLNHMEENEMTLTGVVRKSLRVYLEKDESKKETIEDGEKIIPQK
ncbi:MAG: hypothetical protein ABSD71_14615 [Bacteroidales bacterium]